MIDGPPFSTGHGLNIHDGSGQEPRRRAILQLDAEAAEREFAFLLGRPINWLIVEFALEKNLGL